MNKLVFIADKKDAGVKISNFLKYEKDLSTRLIKKLSRKGNILVNGKSVKMDYTLDAGDKIEVDLTTEESQDILPEDIPIEVVYEDSDILIVNKPPFMVVHPTKGHPTGTLSNAVMNYFIKTNQNSIVRLVNRLDRDTSGLVMIAKSQFAHQQMANKMDKNEIDKYYIAVVEGYIDGSGTIDLPIDRPSLESIKREVMEGGQRAVTHYEVLKASNDMSLVLIKLETGKTHQIRVHFSHIGHPLIGDTLYGRESNLINRQALHAYKLKFTTIREGKEIEITADIPEDIQKLIDYIEK
ncbi:RluA family pseudouridine synthase [Thermobrachium celere]|uniref:Pseudouridine synthase n=1 Tax=Thermobrachium celere DSM 8682 TaxID=941824 RepID=R7RRA6_9CLOT|nr:RluA family pseudouridine synthase [Thermobrachium celere]CDF58564.1 Ribosomal large subunit pseudouridine synthase D [Thermobrachium celere DSM 8682]